jgi:hypothetical protein
MKTSLTKKIVAGLFFATLSLAMASCSKEDESLSENGLAPKSAKALDACGCERPYAQTITLPQIINANMTLSCSNLYLLSGKVYVTNGATLTIPGGTRIEGLYNADPINASALVITKGAKIEAQGTATCPIVFSGHIDATNPVLSTGDWGGLVLLGKAPVNAGTTGIIEGIDSSIVPAGVDPTYGGTDSADDSGSLSYVRVEYAGASIAANNELNSFTFGGVGTGTQLDHLQSYSGADDSFEFFGGTVNATYLISTAANDDAFDFDLGYTGNLQFLVAVLDANHDYSANANGIECDNNPAGSTTTILTHPVISNLTVVGTSTGATSSPGTGTVLYATHFRKNTRLTLRNSVFYGYATASFLDSSVYPSLSTNKADSHVNTASVFEDNVIGKITTGAWTNTGWTVSSTNSLVADTNTALGINNPYSYANFFVSTSKPLRAFAAPASSGADFTGLTGFTSTAYKGALTNANYWITDTWVNTAFPL